MSGKIKISIIVDRHDDTEIENIEHYIKGFLIDNFQRGREAEIEISEL